MEKMNLRSPDLCQDNIIRIRELFPGCVTEAADGNGKPRLAVDFDQLRQELSGHIVEGGQERYRLDWPGKRQALLAGNSSITKTMRPCRAESLDFDTTRNLFIEGDNLEALKLLQETWLGRVKMIYIDPPYNTGNDFIYDDNFAENSMEFLQRSNQKDDEGNRLVANTESNGRFHSDWLSMMYSRLGVAKKLLSDDGAVVIHIDENEYPNLEKILSEIFGEKNNIGTIVWDKRNPKGDAVTIAQQHELISIYARDRESFCKNVDFSRLKPNADKIISKAELLIKSHGAINENCRHEYKKWLARQDFSGGEKAYSLIDDLGRVYRTVSMSWPNKKKAPDDYFIPLVHPKTNKPCPVPKRGWRNPSITMKRLLEAGEIIFGKDENVQPTRKYLLSKNIKENVPSLLYFGGSDDLLFNELGLSFDNPKPLGVVKQIIQSICTQDDMVMDFFAGSGTTAHAVLDLNSGLGMNLQFVLVQLPHEISEGVGLNPMEIRNIADLSKERIRRAGRKILEGECHPDWNKDIGFRVLRIDSSNMADVFYTPDRTFQADLLARVDNVKPDRTSEDLLFQVMLDRGVDPTLPIRRETIQGKIVFSVDNTALMACFDDGISETLVRKLAKYKPSRMVFRNTGFESDSVKINVEQIFKRISPNTEIKSL